MLKIIKRLLIRKRYHNENKVKADYCFDPNFNKYITISK